MYLRTLAVSIQHIEVKPFGVIPFYQVANTSLKNTLNVFTGKRLTICQVIHVSEVSNMVHTFGRISFSPRKESSGSPDYIMLEKLPLQLLGCIKQMKLLYIM